MKTKRVSHGAAVTPSEQPSSVMGHAHSDDTATRQESRPRLRSALGRMLDPRYPPHLAILSAATAAGAIAFVAALAGKAGFTASLSDGFLTGAAVFFGWALAREYDPDHNLPAFVAALLAFVVAIGWDVPRFGVLLWLLLLGRLLNRVVGSSPTSLDRLAIIGLGAWISLTVHWGAGIVTALGLLLDSEMAPSRKRQRVFAVLALAGAAAGFVFGPGAASQRPVDATSALAVAALVVLTIPLVAAAGSVRSHTDYGHRPLLGSRLRAAQLMAAGSGAALALTIGSAGIVLLAPMWSALAAGSLFSISQLVRQLRETPT